MERLHFNIGPSCFGSTRKLVGPGYYWPHRKAFFANSFCLTKTFLIEDKVKLTFDYDFYEGYGPYLIRGLFLHNLKFGC